MEFRPERGRVREPEKEIIDKKIIDKIVDKIEKIYPKEKEEVERLAGDWMRSEDLEQELKQEFFRKVPEFQPKFLEEVLNGLVEKWKGKKYNSMGLGLFFSFLINTMVEKYVEEEKKKGKKWEDIEPLAHLGWENQEKSHLTIKQQDGVYIGEEMRGGKVIVEGDCEDSVGERMSGGEIIIKGDCQGYVGTKMSGGKIIIEGYCGHDNALKMTGGSLIFQGGVEEIDSSAFTERNRGEIWVREEGRMKRIHPMIIPLDKLRR